MAGMKKNGKIFAAAVSVCGVALCCGSCVGRTGMRETNSIRIGVGLYRGDDTFINNIRSELESQAKEYEKETGIKVKLDIVDAKGSQNTQNNQAERFLSLDCDVLCMNPVDRMMVSGLIDKAMAAEVPVVFFNRQPVEEDMNRWDQLYYVGADAKESAVLQGEIVVDLYRKQPEALDINGDGVVSYVLLEGESSHQDSLIRTEWSIQTLKNGGVPIEKLTGGIANWERSQASALMEQWLDEYPDKIELVISNNDDMALGALDAIERSGTMQKIKLVGIDATNSGMEAVQSRKLLGTVSSDKKKYAWVIMQIAAAKARGEEIPEEINLDRGKYYWTAQEKIVKEQ